MTAAGRAGRATAGRSRAATGTPLRLPACLASVRPKRSSPSASALIGRMCQRCAASDMRPPKRMVGIGMGIAAAIIVIDLVLERRRSPFRTPVLAVALHLDRARDRLRPEAEPTLAELEQRPDSAPDDEALHTLAALAAR